MKKRRKLEAISTRKAACYLMKRIVFILYIKYIIYKIEKIIFRDKLINRKIDIISVNCYNFSYG